MSFSSLVASLQTVADGANPTVVGANPTVVGANPTVVGANPTVANGAQPKEKIKLFLISTHINQTTGYAKVSYGLIGELAQIPWLSLVHYGIQGIAGLCPDRTYPSSVKVYDVLALETKKQNGFGFEELAGVLQAEKPDLVLVYNDIGVVCQYLEAMEPVKKQLKAPFQTWVYLDQVYNSQPPDLLEILNAKTDRVFCFTRAWRDILRGQGISRPIDVIPHGIDPTITKPMERAEARRILKIPDDTFLFLSVNRNQPRKRLDLLIMAFAELIVKHPQKPIFLMCLCDKGEKGGYPLFDIFARELHLQGVNPEHFANRLMVSAQDMRFTDEEVNLFYNAADVGVSTADGEGFGLCAFEQMALGVPQVLSDVVGHREYCNEGNSILVKTKARYYQPHCMTVLSGESNAVLASDFASGMERYVLRDDLRRMHGAAARTTVAAYTWPAVTERLRRHLAIFKEEKMLEAEM
jgi:glycosyltransferase involved in cell wall biosynthesis